MRPKRITYIHQHFVDPRDGGGTRSWEFARRLAADGHRVTIVAGGGRDGVSEASGFTVIRVRTPYSNSMGFVRRLLAFAQFVVKSLWVASRTPADIVFASSTPLTVAIPGVAAAKFQHARFVLEVRDVWPEVPVALGYLKNPLLKCLAVRLERWSYSKSDEIIALSPGMAESVRRRAPGRRVAIIPNGCDFEVFAKHGDRGQIRSGLGVGSGEKLVVYAGSLGAIYAIPWLVRLAAALHGHGVHFRIIGDGSTRDASEKLAASLGLDPKQVFLGRQSKDNVAKAFHAADATASPVMDHPALYPASINKVFDSMAAGRPVVFSSTGWLAQLMEEGAAGLILPSSIDTAAKVLLATLEDEKNLARMGGNAARIGREQFDRDDQYASLVAVLTRPFYPHV